jgi:two-component system, chemotaxis family, sensor kinase CheA
VLEDVFDYARNGILEITGKMINEIFKAFDAMNKSFDSIKKDNKELDLDKYSEIIKKMTGVATEGAGKSKRSENGTPEIVKDNEEHDKEKKIQDEKKEETSTEVNTNYKKEEGVSHIKVPVKRLDNLMDLTEELLIDKMKLELLVDPDDIGESISDISKKNALDSVKPTVEHLSSLVSNLQFYVMQARLVPVGQIFSRFPRMIRDLALAKEKEIELEIVGGDLELDRTIIDQLGQPLVHLLRNAVDHGVDKEGVIKLKASRSKDFVIVVVEDNGKGIDWSVVVNSALKKNIINNDQHENYLDYLKSKSVDIKTRRRIINLIFHPQLSTNEKVTETSGRGVGLSVVKKFIDNIGGNIIVENIKTGGTRFTLELPLTLAIIKTLLVKIKESVFAIPFSSIERVVSIGKDEIKSMADQDIAVVNGIRVPLVKLNRIFNLEDNKVKEIVSEMDEALEDIIEDENLQNNKKELKSEIKTVVLVKRGKEIAGLVVDKLLNEQEIIVKSLPAVLKGVKGFSGSTILGRGETILILDVVSLLDDSSKLIRI